MGIETVGRTLGALFPSSIGGNLFFDLESENKLRNGEFFRFVGIDVGYDWTAEGRWRQSASVFFANGTEAENKCRFELSVTVIDGEVDLIWETENFLKGIAAYRRADASRFRFARERIETLLESIAKAPRSSLPDDHPFLQSCAGVHLRATGGRSEGNDTGRSR